MDAAEIALMFLALDLLWGLVECLELTNTHEVTIRTKDRP